MKMRTVLTLLLLVALTLMNSSCVSSESVSLGDRYVYRYLGEAHSYIFNTEFEYLDPADAERLFAPNHPTYYERLIPCYIKDYAFDEDFIIASQITNPNCGFDALRQDMPETGNAINYWIVIKGKRKTIGPMTLEEYHVKREEYHVPDGLKLKSN